MRTTMARASAVLSFMILFLAAAPAMAQESAWNHQGSLMKLIQNGNEIMIKYLDPKQTLRQHGVQRGTVLFQGTLSDETTLKGSAFAFHEGCDAVSFDATGRFDRRSMLESFEFEGHAPQWPEKGCERKAIETNAPPAKFVFTPYGSEEEALEEQVSALDKDTGSKDAATKVEASVLVTSAINTAAGFPREAASHGGAVRDGPAMKSAQLDSLEDGDPITILEDTGQSMNGFNWYKIRYQGGKGYHWGGLICVQGQPLQGALDVCK